MNEGRKKKFVHSCLVFFVLLLLSILFLIPSKLVPGLHFVNGGTICLSMFPLILIGLALGPVWGGLAGLVFAFVDLYMDNGFGFHWVSLFLDYFLAFGFSFVCGFFRKSFYRKKCESILFSSLSFFVLRYLCHFLSGVLIVYPDGNEGFLVKGNPFNLSSVSHSLSYNAGYLIPSFILAVVVLVYCAPLLFHFSDSKFMKCLYPKNLQTDDSLSIEDKSRFYLIVSLFVSSLLFLIPHVMQNYGKKLGLLVISCMILSCVFVLSSSIYRYAEDKISNRAYSPSFRIPYKLFGFKYKYDMFLILFSFFPLFISVSDFILFATRF